jgi:hypothetical protein
LESKFSPNEENVAVTLLTYPENLSNIVARLLSEDFIAFGTNRPSEFITYRLSSCLNDGQYIERYNSMKEKFFKGDISVITEFTPLLKRLLSPEGLEIKFKYNPAGSELRRIKLNNFSVSTLLDDARAEMKAGEKFYFNKIAGNEKDVYPFYIDLK